MCGQKHLHNKAGRATPAMASLAISNRARIRADKEFAQVEFVHLAHLRPLAGWQLATVTVSGQWRVGLVVVWIGKYVENKCYFNRQS